MLQHHKKYQKSGFHLLLAIGLSALCNLAQAQQVTVNFTGTVTAANCTVQNGTAVTVPLSAVKVTDFTAAQTAVSSSTRSTEVTLTNCPARSTLTLTLNGEEDPSGNGRLKINSGPNMATGVAIAVLYTDSGGGESWRSVGPNASVTQLSADANGSARFKIGGSLLKRAANIPVTPGQVEASMTMTITAN